METFFLCHCPLWKESAGHQWIPSQSPVTQSYDCLFDLHLNKRLSKQPRRWRFDTPSRSLWRHCHAVCLAWRVVMTSTCIAPCICSQIAKFIGPTWGPPGSCRSQMGPMLDPWTLLSGFVLRLPWHSSMITMFNVHILWAIVLLSSRHNKRGSISPEFWMLQKRNCKTGLNFQHKYACIHLYKSFILTYIYIYIYISHARCWFSLLIG